MKRIKCFSVIILLLFASFAIHVHAEEEANTHVHIVDYDHPISFEEIKARYTSYDAIDGNLTERLIFQSEYEEDYNKNSLSVKSYPLYVSVTNSRNKTIKWEDEISVRDFTAPVLSSTEKEISIDLSKDDVQTILSSMLTIIDNYDTTFNSFNFEGLEELEQGPGTYSLRCFVEDNSRNSSNEIILIVHCYETIQRQIASTPILIENKALDTNELLASFLQNNNIEPNYQTVQVQTSYLDNPLKQGIFQAQFIFNYPDGKQQIYQCKIVNSLVLKKKKDDKIIYISLSCILLLTALGIILYRKRC
ncbi:MAG: hypothetical protein K2M84_00185 [Anaeroplasmataceae bacterium]|nr:hypothetical protein [Anaeroplasmataceae bacterium]